MKTISLSLNVQFLVGDNFGEGSFGLHLEGGDMVLTSAGREAGRAGEFKLKEIAFIPVTAEQDSDEDEGAGFEWYDQGQECECCGGTINDQDERSLCADCNSKPTPAP